LALVVAARGSRPADLRSYCYRQLQPFDVKDVYRSGIVGDQPEIGVDVTDIFNYLTGFSMQKSLPG
jgi:hypothetical protein